MFADPMFRTNTVFENRACSLLSFARERHSGHKMRHAKYHTKPVRNPFENLTTSEDEQFILNCWQAFPSLAMSYAP